MTRENGETHEAEIVIVGGGSAGAALAGRLVGAGRDVLLVEAGPDYGPFAGGGWPRELVDARTIPTSHDWGLASGRWQFERARVIGGCSSHNGAIAAVGHRSDYDGWGLPGWSADEVQPVFDRVIEAMRVRAYDRNEVVPFHAQCLDAAAAMGWTIASDLCDLDANDSFGLETVNIVDGVRWNAAFAYLDPVRDRPNLRIIDHVLVDRVVEGPTGPTVHASRAGEPISLRGATVVLCAGVYGSPAILQRSGVGDRALLTPLGIDVVNHQPGVGANLHDHPMMHADRTVGTELQTWLDEVAASGFLPEEQTLGKFVSSRSNNGIYDTHLFPVVASDQTRVLYRNASGPSSRTPSTAWRSNADFPLHGRVAIEVAVLNPRSRGGLAIVSRDPSVAPRLDHRYLSDEGDHDLAVMMDGLRQANQLLDHPLVAPLLGPPVTDVSTPEAVRSQVVHYYHPVGTCAMGVDSDERSVCDQRGRVRGLSDVVVADASLMPRIPRANTNLPSIMIGERVADFLLGHR